MAPSRWRALADSPPLCQGQGPGVRLGVGDRAAGRAGAGADLHRRWDTVAVRELAAGDGSAAVILAVDGQDHAPEPLLFLKGTVAGAQALVEALAVVRAVQALANATDEVMVPPAPEGCS